MHKASLTYITYCKLIYPLYCNEVNILFKQSVALPVQEELTSPAIALFTAAFIGCLFVFFKTSSIFPSIVVNFVFVY